MRVTDQQVRKLFMEHQKCGQLGLAALKAGMNRDTAAAYLASGQLPSAREADRDWRTRPDPFAAHWPELEGRLKAAPELEAKALFEWLCERFPGIYQDGQLRTLQRHIQRWRALHGPEQEVYFPQRHRPGVRLSSFEKAKETLTACNAFSEPDEGRLRMPHSLHEDSAPADKGDAG